MLNFRHRRRADNSPELRIGASKIVGMTLAVAFKGPEGLVLAVDSRITLATSTTIGSQTLVSTSYLDTAKKMFGIDGQSHVGVLVYGNMIIGTDQPRGIHGFIPEFEAKLKAKPKGGGQRPVPRGRRKVADIARELGKFYHAKWDAAGMPADGTPIWFLVAGYDEDEPYGRIYGLAVPTAPEPIEYHADDFGVRWGGESDIANRLVNGVAGNASAIAKHELSLTDEQVTSLEKRWSENLSLKIPYGFLPLQDCVDLATLLVRTTSVVQGMTVAGERGVGGPIDVATITQSGGYNPVRQKQIGVRDWQAQP